LIISLCDSRKAFFTRIPLRYGPAIAFGRAATFQWRCVKAFNLRGGIMRNQGIRKLDKADSEQIVWLVLSSAECPDSISERRVEASFFLVPHNAWSWPAAFADPVYVRRTRRRILFIQHAGVCD
jgi:hypothetical protein